MEEETKKLDELKKTEKDAVEEITSTDSNKQTVKLSVAECVPEISIAKPEVLEKQLLPKLPKLPKVSEEHPVNSSNSTENVLVTEKKDVDSNKSVSSVNSPKCSDEPAVLIEMPEKAQQIEIPAPVKVAVQDQPLRDSSPPALESQVKERKKSGDIKETKFKSLENMCGVKTIETSNIISPPLEYWVKRNPVVDQIFITDVTSNLVTVTVRECNTDSGFFKSRDCLSKNTTNGV